MTKLSVVLSSTLFLVCSSLSSHAAIAYFNLGSGVTATDNGGLSGETQSIAVNISLNNQTLNTSVGIGSSGNKLTLTPVDEWVTGTFPDLFFHSSSGKLGEAQNTDISGSNLILGTSYGGGAYSCSSFICINSPSTKNISGTHLNQYRGFKMYKSSSNNSQSFSGWFKFDLRQPNNASSYVTLKEVAIEFTANKAITIGDKGQVPEPSSAILGIFSFAIFASRRVRNH